MHLSLARKYRPKTFASVAVQSHVSNTLRGAIARGRVAHGYLLCGPRGVGKTTLARVLAMALNCERRIGTADASAPNAGEPCGECASCTRIWSGSASLDVVEIDAASNRGVDDARELRERAMYAPSTEQHYKVYIVDEAHMLTREAWNALLKILEEPPPRVVFVFATTEPQRIANTAAPVLSRLQRFDFKRMSPADVRARLNEVLAAEKVDAEPEAIAMLARAADGSMRDALSLADQALALGDGSLTAARVREALGLVPEDEYLRILDLVVEGGGRAGDLFPAVGRLVEEGVDLVMFLGGFADLLRGQLAITLGGDVADMSERTREALRQRVGRLTSGDLLRMLGAVTEIEPRFRRSAQQQLLLEALLVRCALMDRTVSLEEVLRTLGGDSGQGAARRERPPAPAPVGEPPRRAKAAQPADRPAAGSTVYREPAQGPAAPPRPTALSASVAEPPPMETESAPWASRLTSEAGDGGGGAALALAPPVVAGANSPSAPVEPLELNRLVERWGDVAGALRSAGRSMLATALERAVPVAVTARGDITLELEEPLDLYADAIEGGALDIAAAVAMLFSGVARVRLVRRAVDGSLPPPQRLTEAALKGERLALLCRRDPSLAAAVRELDLDLVEWT